VRKLKTNIILLSMFAALLVNPAQAATVKADDPSYKVGLQELQNIVPLTYNNYVRDCINNLSGQRKRFSQMLGLSKYYFPIYEKVFKERNIPEELKYLSVVESSLNPQAVSRAEAVGPWQFLYEVGKKYGLAVNDTVDERRDPVLASNAAASYLLDAYEMYSHDWLLVIASYNCGHNNIKWAMEEAGGKKDYWSLRKYLPVETQNYVPYFIATVYVMNNYRKYGIAPIDPDFSVQTESVPVKKNVYLAEIAQKANMSAGELFVLNPAYKRGIVNGSEKAPRNLVLPVLPTYSYNAICALVGAPPRLIGADPATAPAAPVVYYLITYTIQPGDNLTSIAAKFHGATEKEIRDVNRLTENPVLTPGNILNIRQAKIN
jgi:membrane-bound lytic murein transglycosylase D